jgi:hypothetical protein
MILAAFSYGAALIVNVLVSGSRKEVILKVRDGLSEGAIDGMTEG